MSMLLTSSFEGFRPASMNCQYCGERLNRYYNLRRHEDEYCPYQEQKADSDDLVESSPPKKTCDAETDDESTLSHDNDETSRSSDDQDDDDVEIGPWAELIDEAKQTTSSAYEELLQNLIYEGYDEQQAKTEAYSLVLPKLEKA